MTPVVWGFFLLVVLPPILMGLSHLYAISAQDNGDWYVVSLDSRIRSVDKVMADQVARFQLTIDAHWDSPAAKGYSAFVPRKNVVALSQDKRTVSMQLRDDSF